MCHDEDLKTHRPDCLGETQFLVNRCAIEAPFRGGWFRHTSPLVALRKLKRCAGKIFWQSAPLPFDWAAALPTRSDGFIHVVVTDSIYDISRFTLHTSALHSVALMQLRFTSFALASLWRDLYQRQCAHARHTNK